MLVEHGCSNLGQKVKRALDAKIGATRTVTVTAIDQLSVGGARNETVGGMSGERGGITKLIVGE